MSCTCQRCGNKYKVDLLVEDDLWDTISKGKNLLCSICILKAIECLNNYAAFKLENLTNDKENL